MRNAHFDVQLSRRAGVPGDGEKAAGQWDVGGDRAGRGVEHECDALADGLHLGQREEALAALSDFQVLVRLTAAQDGQSVPAELHQLLADLLAVRVPWAAEALDELLRPNGRVLSDREDEDGGRDHCRRSGYFFSGGFGVAAFGVAAFASGSLPSAGLFLATHSFHFAWAVSRASSV